MLRRTAIAALLGAVPANPVRAEAAMDRAFGAARGTGLLLDFRTRRLIAVEHPDLARGWLVPPGSTLKPLSLSALIETGKLAADEEFPCSGSLTIARRSFACSHPPIGVPVRPSTAIAYSCNCFVAHVAQRFAPGELARRLAREGLCSRTALLGESEAAGQVEPATSMAARQLQALGEERVLVTAVELLMAYYRLAARASRPEMASILNGLEGAVDYGTAQLAHVAGLKVAGKTGSAVTSTGVQAAWFAGFAPSRSPQVVVTVLVHGRSGGADAAPIERRLLEAHVAGQL